MHNWRKSSYSSANGSCVEVGTDGTHIGVRDTKLGETSPVLVFSVTAWREFLAAATSGRL